jgi:WD40 repeat protein
LLSHGSTVEAVALDPAGEYLATKAQGATVRIWNLETKELDHEWPDNKESRSLRFGNTGWVLASCDGVEPWKIRRWSHRSKREEELLDCFEPVCRIGAFTTEDDYLAAIVDHGQLEEDVVAAWKLKGHDPGRLGGYLKGNGLIDVAFSADDSLIATSGCRHFAEVRFFAREQAISTPTYTMRFSGGSGQAIAFDPGGRYLAIASLDRVRLWDFRSNREVGTIDHPDVKALAFDADGDVLTTVTSTDVERWAVARGRILSEKVHAAKGPLEPDEIVDMVPPMVDRIGRPLTVEEKAAYVPSEPGA